MRNSAVLVLVAVLLSSGCAGDLNHREKLLFSVGATGSGSGSLIGWANACPACGSDLGGSAVTAAYLYQSTEKSRGPGTGW
jgi:hypothetical protein